MLCFGRNWKPWNNRTVEGGASSPREMCFCTSHSRPECYISPACLLSHLSPSLELISWLPFSGLWHVINWSETCQVERPPPRRSSFLLYLGSRQRGWELLCGIAVTGSLAIELVPSRLIISSPQPTLLPWQMCVSSIQREALSCLTYQTINTQMGSSLLWLCCHRVADEVSSVLILRVIIIGWR